MCDLLHSRKKIAHLVSVYQVYMYQYVFVVLHEIDCVIGYLR